MEIDRISVISNELLKPSNINTIPIDNKLIADKHIVACR
jgi:hypothetical protein